MLPIQHLLPLRAVNICLQFTAAANPRLFHHLALTAWLRHLIGEVPNYERYITLDAPESGRVAYQKGDFYRFTLFALNGGEELLQHILNCLVRLPKNVKIRDKVMPFRDNLIFHQADDLFTNSPVQAVAELSCYSFDTLQQETNLWLEHEQCWISWVSPVRLLLPLQSREPTRGKKSKQKEERFCRHRSQVDFAVFNDRIYDALAELLRQRVDDVPSRITDESQRLQMADVFWMDYSYYNVKGYEKPMGGLLGRMAFDTEDMPKEQWLYWVLGQYVGIGQRRSFGWGRYLLESAETGRTVARCSAKNSLLEVACRLDNLEGAFAETSSNKDLSGFGNLTGLDEDEERLIHLREQLLNNKYKIPALHKQTLTHEDGSSGLLQVPPFFDRVAQRAVAQVLTPSLNTLRYSGSFGLRRGHSRHSATQMIQKANREGYRWVLESDVDDFSANIQWSRLYTRLTAFFGDDVVVDLVMGWMTASVDGEEREVGLPPGSPLSPVLANIMLDDFDSDLEAAGLRLVRFADDFLVLTRTEGEAEVAKKVVIDSLVEVGLEASMVSFRVQSFVSLLAFPCSCNRRD